jgi:hypothetical protein
MTTPFPFICYLQDGFWACEKLVAKRRAYTIKQQCTWSDGDFQPCCTMKVSQQPVAIQFGFFLYTYGWQTFNYVALPSALL